MSKKFKIIIILLIAVLVIPKDTDATTLQEYEDQVEKYQNELNDKNSQISASKKELEEVQWIPDQIFHEEEHGKSKDSFGEEDCNLQGDQETQEQNQVLCSGQDIYKEVRKDILLQMVAEESRESEIKQQRQGIWKCKDELTPKS